MGIPIPLGQLQVDPDYLAIVSNAGPLQKNNWKGNAATVTTHVLYKRVCCPFVAPWCKKQRKLKPWTRAWVDKQTYRH